MSRTPLSAEYDAVVDLAPSSHHVPPYAYALVKLTYRVVQRGLVLARAEPLDHDLRVSPTGELPKSLPLGSDFWLHKRQTDVVVHGAAHSPDGAPTARMEVSCEVGARRKRIAVFGRRFIEWRHGRARLGAPEPFTRMPIDNAHAYGGVDTRVPYPPIRSLVEALVLGAEHPGTYPRNATGKGYYVMPDRFDGIELPNLEDPRDLLCDERLIVGDPARWYRQPLPSTFSWQHGATFPRRLYFGSADHDLGATAELEEVRRGILPADYERLLSSPGASATTEEEHARAAFFARYYQEAVPDMQFAPLAPTMPINVTGMAEGGRTMAFSVPAPPRLEIEADGAREQVAPRITNLVIIPADGRVLITYCARTATLPRPFIPGIHAHIPLSLHMNGARVLTYETPPRLFPHEAAHG